MTNEAARQNTEVDNAGTLDDQWGDALSEQAAEEQKAADGVEAPKAEAPKSTPAPGQPRVADVKKIETRPASFNALTNEPAEAVGNINMVLDIPITVSVELGRTRMMVKEFLQLGQGTVVELDKLAGEPMEILVNGSLIARGEAVVVNEKFGIKLTDIVTPSERINKLK